MAFNAYCLVDGVTGEAKDANHDGWIEILSYSHGIVQRHNMGGGTGSITANGPDFGTFSFVKQIDKSTADLNKLCALGSQIKEVQIEVCQAVGGQQPVLTVTLSDVIVASVSASGGGDGRPLDSVELAYNKIEWLYRAYSDNGETVDGEFTAGWDLATNQPV